MVQLKLEMLSIYQEKIIESFRQKIASSFLKRKIYRNYIIGKVLQEKLLNLDTFYIQDGDADAAFT